MCCVVSTFSISSTDLKKNQKIQETFYSLGETEQLKKLEVQSIFDDLKKNNDIKSMIELEEKVFQTLKSEPIISGCLDFVSSSSCDKKELLSNGMYSFNGKALPNREAFKF